MADGSQPGMPAQIAHGNTSCTLCAMSIAGSDARVLSSIAALAGGHDAMLCVNVIEGWPAHGR